MILSWKGLGLGLAALMLLTASGPAMAQSPFATCAGVLARTAPYSFSSAPSAVVIHASTVQPPQQTYICAINLVAASSINVALVAGTTTTSPCDTNTVGLAGGATAATGWSLSTNDSQVNYGNGQGLVARADAGLDVCLFSSGNAQVAGVLTFAQW